MGIFWLQYFISIPLVGLICAIVFACDSSNLNPRNFARSYFCGLLIAVILIVLFAVLAGAGMFAFTNSMKLY